MLEHEQKNMNEKFTLIFFRDGIMKKKLFDILEPHGKNVENQYIFIIHSN